MFASQFGSLLFPKKINLCVPSKQSTEQEDEAKAQAAAKLQALNRGKKGRTNAQNRKSVLELFKTLDEDGDGSIQVGENFYDFARNPRELTD